jgi:hypothetical protein
MREVSDALNHIFTILPRRSLSPPIILAIGLALCAHMSPDLPALTVTRASRVHGYFLVEWEQMSLFFMTPYIP